MKKLKIVILTLTFVTISVVGIVYATQVPSSNSISGDFQEGTFATKLFMDGLPFVPVTYFTNMDSDITKEELLKSQLISYEENIEILPEGIIAEIISEEDIYAELAAGKIALLRPSQVSPKMKTLIVDGFYYWDYEEGYPLVSYQLKFTSDVEKEDEHHTFFAGGEIIPARAVDRLGLNKYNNYTYLFDYYRDDIEDSDIAIALLENSIQGNPSPCTGCMSFLGDEQVAGGLSEVGFDFLSTAGNHAGDAGQSAYASTISLLNDKEIQTTGTGDTEDNVISPTVMEVNGVRVGMISADDVAFYYWKKLSNEGVYGTNWFSIYNSGAYSIDEERVQQINSIKEENEIDYLIVYMSWGVEYTNYPTNHQQNLAKAILDNGADIIIGSHPHWVQSIEFYGDKPIIYSLGNFIFDQTHTTPTREGATVKLHYLDQELKSIEIMPHLICGYHQNNNDLTPKLLGGELSLDEIYDYPEANGCVFWQAKKLKPDHPSYREILERMFEYTSISEYE
ncbi:CapA family protein [Candidatus Dojkabacteria bacterium]|uniref:CapA family protein n=1 Tax=Candidatus Dojkabacteria bacterium TaxID=2099670 RepID=A0A955L6J0_9BACT|nr:CapA family protein [Candidatus Dojkabacteria bacterium]